MDKVQIVVFAIQFIRVLSNLVIYAVIARVIVSWFTMGNFRRPGRFVQMLNDVTEPLMSLVRKLPHRIGMIDLSPMILIFGVDLLSRLLIKLLAGLI